MTNIFEGNNQCWVDIQNIQILDLDITHDIRWMSSWMIFGVTFSLSDITCDVLFFDIRDLS
jgi:hypothetical protein